jgi:tryptophan synthase alpha chain
MNGLEHIASAFASARAAGRAALMPYFTLGFPTSDDSLAVIEALACSGADLIELGIPFSDPLADGPTIQRSTQVALEQGMNVSRCLELVAAIRARGVHQPLLLMGYINPILAYGGARYAADARAAGADGLIIPDLPVEEAAEVEAACQAENLALVYLAAPTSTRQRLETLAAHTTGFLYLVSLTGVTGARTALADDLEAFTNRARATLTGRQGTPVPLAVGFGIATPAQAALVGALADGVIIGSALVNAVAQSDDPAGSAAGYLAPVRTALEKSAVQG